MVDLPNTMVDLPNTMVFFSSSRFSVFFHFFSPVSFRLIPFSLFFFLLQFILKILHQEFGTDCLGLVVVLTFGGSPADYMAKMGPKTLNI